VKFCKFFKFFLERRKLPFFGQNCSLPFSMFSLRSLSWYPCPFEILEEALCNVILPNTECPHSIQFLIYHPETIHIVELWQWHQAPADISKFKAHMHPVRHAWLCQLSQKATKSDDFGMDFSYSALAYMNFLNFMSQLGPYGEINLQINHFIFT
jgi:hypothetical protein